MSKPTDRERREALERWSNTPAANPRYKGATPADVVRALLGKKVPRPTKQEGRGVKSDM